VSSPKPSPDPEYPLLGSGPQSDNPAGPADSAIPPASAAAPAAAGIPAEIPVAVPAEIPAAVPAVPADVPVEIPADVPAGVPADVPAGVPAGPITVGGSRLYVAVKRLLDVVLAGAGLLLSFPLLAVLALLIKLESRGPAMYAAERVGEGGRRFACHKLRTMRTDMDDKIHRDYLRYLIENSESVVAERIRDDPRITRVGRWLRKSSLDELPQLWNVLRGEMSLIGPRPPLPYEVDCYQPWQMCRLAVRPGLTGYWQVLGRGTVTFDDMCRMDLTYIEKRSLGLDLWILFKTPLAVASRRGAG
jgi:lipopolysaccharide/colanic/teichoic acid biosynthesis glycosyltransferase